MFIIRINIFEKDEFYFYELTLSEIFTFLWFPAALFCFVRKSVRTVDFYFSRSAKSSVDYG